MHIKTITDHFWKGKMNMSYPSYLEPLFQNNRNLSYENNFDLHEMICTIMSNTFYFEWFRTKTRCDTEAQGNWEMAYSVESKRIAYYIARTVQQSS